jgi:hypothetical protein
MYVCLFVDKTVIVLFMHDFQNYEISAECYKRIYTVLSLLEVHFNCFLNPLIFYYFYLSLFFSVVSISNTRIK